MSQQYVTRNNATHTLTHTLTHTHTHSHTHTHIHTHTHTHISVPWVFELVFCGHINVILLSNYFAIISFPFCKYIASKPYYISLKVIISIFL